MYQGGICFITDTTLSPLNAEDQVVMALDAGVRFLQYREKSLPRREIYSVAKRLRAITRALGAVFIVNDHADIALAVDADGVHLGQDDLPLAHARKIMGGKIIGISTHDETQAVRAARGGADYVGFGPMFPTTTKDAGSPRGTAMLTEIRKRVTIPIVAIGGITQEVLPEIFRAGADAAAFASAILKADDPRSVAARLVATAAVHPR